MSLPDAPKVIGALVAPGEMLPVSKPPPFCVAVCATLSSLCQRTCCPTWTFAVAGA